MGQQREIYQMTPKINIKVSGGFQGVVVAQVMCGCFWGCGSID
jgi:hypothetical protein